MPRSAILLGATILALVALAASLVTIRLSNGQGIDITLSFRVEPRQPNDGLAATIPEVTSTATVEPETSIESSPEAPPVASPDVLPSPSPTSFVAPLTIPTAPVPLVAPLAPAPLLIREPVPAATTLPEPTAPTPIPTATPTALPPAIVLSTTTLVFERGESVKSFFVRNAGAGQVAWRVISQQSWLIASPGAGTAPGAETVQVRVVRDVAGPLPLTGRLVVTSNVGTSVIAVRAE